MISAKLTALAALAAVLLGACRGSRSEPTPSPTAPPAAASAPSNHRDNARGADDRPVILFVGTSLTAGLGLDPSEAYPALIQAKADAAGLRYRVVNAGVSGETSAGALRRVDWLLRQPVAVLVLETGANDGLRGHDPETTRANIQGFLAAARRQDPPPRLALVAMEALPNYGEPYRRRFRAIYPQLAAANGATLLPFLLEGVAGEPALNQPDGIHPTAEGHERVALNVWRALRPIL